jgi:hypothetical protein
MAIIRHKIQDDVDLLEGYKLAQFKFDKPIIYRATSTGTSQFEMFIGGVNSVLPTTHVSNTKRLQLPTDSSGIFEFVLTAASAAGRGYVMSRFWIGVDSAGMHTITQLYVPSGAAANLNNLGVTANAGTNPFGATPLALDINTAQLRVQVQASAADVVFVGSLNVISFAQFPNFAQGVEV